MRFFNESGEQVFPAAGEWQPMETAPKDRVILVAVEAVGYGGPSFRLVSWHEDNGPEWDEGYTDGASYCEGYNGGEYYLRHFSTSILLAWADINTPVTKEDKWRINDG